MYKALLKNIKKNKFKRPSRNNPISRKIPHYIFSTENPTHTPSVIKTNSQVIDHLKKRGYEIEEAEGKYGSDENSIIVYNPPKHAIKQLNKLAKQLGQDSSMISDGHTHELHYHNGPNAGKINRGSGTIFHSEEPSDFYTKMRDGTCFTHNIDADNFYDASESTLHKQRKNSDTGGLLKSEDSLREGKMPYISKQKQHPLETGNSDLKLVHYSPTEGLENIDPSYHGVRKIGAEAKQGQPNHPTSFHYLEGVEPESIVTSSSKHKYISNLGNRKIYDMGKDPLNLRSAAAEKAQAIKDEKNKGFGRMMANREDIDNAYHQSIKDNGFHGYYNSGFGKDHTMSHVVALYDSIKPESSHKLHSKDFQKTSSEDHHATDGKFKNIKKFAKENGHHNHRFLRNLSHNLDKNNG